VNGSRVRLELSAEPRSVREARGLVRTALSGWDLDHLETSAVLLVSELATNVVLHARTDFVVEAEQRGDVVRVSITDGSANGPARRRHGVQAGTGRGLGLVATLATDWGTATAEHPWAKTVWFELPVDPAALPDPGEGALLVQ
jgi:anti-sigma regulatory factor (Ser/Thr protein kinase)